MKGWRRPQNTALQCDNGSIFKMLFIVDIHSHTSISPSDVVTCIFKNTLFSHMEELWIYTPCWTIMATPRNDHSAPSVYSVFQHTLLFAYFNLCEAKRCSQCGGKRSHQTNLIPVQLQWPHRCWALLVQRWHQPCDYWMRTVRPLSSTCNTRVVDNLPVTGQTLQCGHSHTLVLLRIWIWHLFSVRVRK